MPPVMGRSLDPGYPFEPEPEAYSGLECDPLVLLPTVCGSCRRCWGRVPIFYPFAIEQRLFLFHLFIKPPVNGVPSVKDHFGPRAYFGTLSFACTQLGPSRNEFRGISRNRFTQCVMNREYLQRTRYNSLSKTFPRV